MSKQRLNSLFIAVCSLTAAVALNAGCSESDESDRDSMGEVGGNASAGGSSGSGVTGGSNGNPDCGHAGETEPAAVAGVTAAHNAVRCALAAPSPVPPLKWDSAVAAVAQSWADQLAQTCTLSHSTNLNYGENLFGGSGSQSGKSVVNDWVDTEAGCFSYGKFPGCCSCDCGHYTQIVWRDSVKLGCGVASCAGGGQVWVCNYQPPGNFVGMMPY